MFWDDCICMYVRTTYVCWKITMKWLHLFTLNCLPYEIQIHRWSCYFLAELDQGQWYKKQSQNQNWQHLIWCQHFVKNVLFILDLPLFYFMSNVYCKNLVSVAKWHIQNCLVMRNSFYSFYGYFHKQMHNCALKSISSATVMLMCAVGVVGCYYNFYRFSVSHFVEEG